MARSIKKGPYVATHLEKKVLAINEGKSKKSVSSKHGAAVPLLLRISSDIHLQCIMVISLFRFM